MSWFSEIQQLEEAVRYHQASAENDRRQGDGVLSNSRSLSQPGFIVVSESAGDSRVQNKPRNRSCNPNEDSVTVRTKIEESKMTKDEETRNTNKTTRSNILGTSRFRNFLQDHVGSLVF